MICLAAVEGRFVLRHPALLAGAALSLVVGALSTGVDFSVLALSGFALAPLAVGTALAAGLAALRSKRHGTEELFGSLPLPSMARTAAHLGSVAWAVSAGLVVLAAVGTAVAARGGPAVRLPTGVVDRSVSVWELAHGPFVVACLGLVAVAVAMWGRSVVGVALVAALPVALQAVLTDGALKWFAPWVNHATTRPGGYWPRTDIAPRTDLVGFATGPLRWHLLFLAGVGVIAVVAALLRHGPTRPLLACASAAIAAGAAGAVLQVA
jgi:hypothetical protein